MTIKKPSHLGALAALAALDTTAVPTFCHDCGRRFEWNDKRLILGSRAYHAETCGPAPTDLRNAGQPEDR